MFVYVSKKQRRYVVGDGLFDWIPSVLGTAGNFVSANKEAIKNVADVIGSVAKAGATTASAVKQIVDVVKAKRAATAGVAKTTALPTPLEKALSAKSIELLKQLASAPQAAAPQPDINSRIAGAGFKTLTPPR